MILTSRSSVLLLCFVTLLNIAFAQTPPVRWAKDGNSYFQVEGGDIVKYTLPANTKSVVIPGSQLIPSGSSTPLVINSYNFSDDQKKLLIYTNTQKVWRINTRGDYWVLSLADKSLRKVGTSQPASSLMFAKFSPDGNKVAYVSQYNVFVEDLASQQTRQLTTDGSRKFINGTFDWVYEEEFACRDGIRWSTDSKSVAFWQLDARGTRDYYMINNTDSVYSRVIPVEYPKVGESPSACRIGVVNIDTEKTTWMNIDGDPRQNYIVRLEFIPGTNDLMLQQISRKHNQSNLIRCNIQTGSATVINSETTTSWIDVITPDEDSYTVDFKHNINWLAGGKEFMLISEKDGWRHLYKVTSDGKKETLLTPGNLDIILPVAADEKSGFVYFRASPTNATQRYLYRSRLDGKGKPERVTPAEQSGTHDYTFSPTAKYAWHNFSSVSIKPSREFISLPAHKALDVKTSIASQMKGLRDETGVEFFKVKTQDGIEMDGWMVKPANFDSAKRYPVVFYVYTEPWGTTVTDSYGTGANPLYNGDLREDGYIYMSLDNRGTPVPKGAAWRKSIYRNFGIVNIRDQAMGAKEIVKWPFVDPDRIAVWGWSGGGSATLNLLFQYPDIYKTGIAIAAVANELTYDNIYQEKYMGLPQENLGDFIKGSPVTHAKKLQGNLLYIHGTGDDNVHYQNAEILVNELIKYNKQFQFMPYPNRTHSISEGDGTVLHLVTLYTKYLREHCPGGPR